MWHNGTKTFCSTSESKRTSSNQKSKRIVRSPKAKPPPITRSKAVFCFDKCSSKNLVPYHQPREHHTTLKGEAFQLLQVCVQYRITAWCGNNPYNGKGYYHDRLCGIFTHELFCNANESLSQASTPTRGGDPFGMKLTKNHRFGSSGFNLTFERLLLGASFRLRVKGAPSNPH
jgi:hypothetical protein